MVRPPAFALVVVFGGLLCACSGGAGGGGLPVPYASDSVQTVGDAAAAAAHHATGTQNAAAAILAISAVGSRIKDAGEQNDETALPTGMRPGTGRCVDGLEFLAPDRRGDADSTETLAFYDAGCRRLARDAVRVYAPAGAGAETVARTVSIYARGNSNAPLAVRTAKSQISAAAFGPYGFPIADTGFRRALQGTLTIGGHLQVLSDSELVVMPGSGAVNVFCQDSAGYNAVGIPSLDATFGWQGGTSAGVPGSRTDDGNGIVTWSSTQSGEVDRGAIGALAIEKQAANEGCPIGAPAYALSGGTEKRAYQIPLVATFHDGLLLAVSVTRADLGNGYALDVRTSGEGFDTTIRGTVSAGALRVAAFAADRFGDGLLTITSTGAEYRLVDWSVVR